MLHPVHCFDFMKDTIHAKFSRSSQNIRGLLKRHPGLGAHTNIITFSPDGATTKYTWSHPTLRPYGQELPIQCKQCMCLTSFKLLIPKHTKGNRHSQPIVLVCQYELCKKELIFHKPKGYKLATSAAEKDERGEWYMGGFEL